MLNPDSWPDILINLPVKQLKYIIIGFGLLLSSEFGLSQMNNSPDQIFSAAMEIRRPVLLYFSGSDWCVPCQKFSKTILADSVFRKFADENLVLVEVDFPQKSTLSKQQVTWNEKLAEEFNPNGVFPYLLLVRADKTIITPLEYLHFDAVHFIQEIKNATTSPH